jgi:hypothetical protein
MLVDEREQFRQAAKGDRATSMQTNLERIRGNSGICVENRTLPTGDAMWVARCRKAVPGGPAVGAFQNYHNSLNGWADLRSMWFRDALTGLGRLSNGWYNNLFAAA